MPQITAVLKNPCVLSPATQSSSEGISQSAGHPDSPLLDPPSSTLESHLFALHHSTKLQISLMNSRLSPGNSSASWLCGWKDPHHMPVRAPSGQQGRNEVQERTVLPFISVFLTFTGCLCCASCSGEGLNERHSQGSSVLEARLMKQ